MNWNEIIKDCNVTLLQTGTTSEITGLVYDSRKVFPGCAFVAVSGGTFDGHAFIGQAVEKGAAMVVLEKVPEHLPEGVTVLKADSVLAVMPRMAVNFYQNPGASLRMIGVTGTKGKTTTTTLIHRILMSAGIKSGLVGTIENKIGDTVYPSGYTTPQAIDLQALLAQMQAEEAKAAVMEVSSHSLVLHRVDGIDFEYGVFTNLSLEHLDFHKTMDDYLLAKMQLFRHCGTGLANIDDPAGQKVCEAGYCPMLSFAIDAEKADIKAENIHMSVKGVEYDLHLPDGKELHIFYPYPGKFNVYNTMAAAAVTYLAGIPEEVIVKELGRTDRIVRGRFQVLHGPDEVAAVVDYAHAPDALLNVLLTIEEFRQGRILTVVGCGGDRDRTKRPVMGRIAGEYSDYVVLTSDNPRTEDPNAILAEIEVGIRETDCSYAVVENRREAIRMALTEAGTGDIVLVAGKGHEDYQILGREKIHFDDVEEVLNFWHDRENKA